jgi:RecA-family ATPase
MASGQLGDDPRDGCEVVPMFPRPPARVMGDDSDLINREEPDYRPPPAPIETYSAAEIFAPLDPPDWTIKGLGIAPGPITAFAGRGEAGKTLALQSAELSIAIGAKIWGELETDQGPVTHVDFEQGKYLTFLRFQRLGNALGCDVDELERRDLIRCAIYPEQRLERASKPSWIRLCEGRRLVVIDSFRAACPRLDENSSEAREPLDMLSSISDDTGCTIVVLLHGRKAQLGDPGGARDSVRGSSAIHDAVQSGFVLQQEQKGGPTVVTHIKSRMDGHKRDPFGLRISDVANGGDERWGVSVTVEDLGELKARAAKREHDRLLDRTEQYLRSKPSCTTAMVRAHLKKRHDVVVAALDELALSGRAKNLGTEKKAEWRAI